MATEPLGGGQPRSLAEVLAMAPSAVSLADTLARSGQLTGAASTAPARGAFGNSAAEIAQWQTAGRQMLAQAGGSFRPQLQAPDASVANLDDSSSQALIELLGAKTNEQSIKTLADEMKSNKSRSSRLTDERVKAIQEATQKAMEAASKAGGFFAKLFGFLGKILQPIVAVLSIVAGAALMATGVGAVAGGFLIANGVMGLANTVLDIVDAVRESQGKEPIGFRLSFGTLVSKGLQALGVDAKVADWIGVGFEIAVTVTAVAVSGGTAAAGLAANAGKAASTGAKAVSGIRSMAQKAGQYLADNEKVMKTANTIRRGTEVVKAGANVGTQVINVQVAALQKDAAEFEARAEELKGRVAQLLKQMQFDTDLIKDLTERVKEINETVSDSVASRSQVGVTMAQNIRVTG